MQARVVASFGIWYLLEANGQELKARLKGKFKLGEKKFTNPIAVGDWVEYEKHEDGDLVIYNILDRKNYLIRKATHDKNKYHVLAANIDYGLIFYAIKNPETTLLFLDNAIAACESFQIKPILFINKIDILNANELMRAEQLKNSYEKMGYAVKLTSLIKNFDEVKIFMKAFADSSILVFGNSGVGKTTFINQINKDLQLKTQETSSYNFKGKHTTSTARLYMPNHFFNISIIDTPGIKELEMVEIKQQDLSYYFLDIKKFKADCQYNNCLHYKEPNCAVKKALANKEIERFRYENYLNMLLALE